MITKFLTRSLLFRQLEAVIRISESLAKMQLQSFVTEQHVEEALRLFRVSTLEAAMSGTLNGTYKDTFFVHFQFGGNRNVLPQILLGFSSNMF